MIIPKNLLAPHTVTCTHANQKSNSSWKFNISHFLHISLPSMNSTRCVCQFILYIFSVLYYPIFTQFHFSFSQTSSKAHGKGSCLLLAHLSKWWHDNNFIARSQVKKPQPGKSTQTDAIPTEIKRFEVARKTFPYMRLLSGSNRYIAVRVTVESTPSPRGREQWASEG